MRSQAMPEKTFIINGISIFNGTITNTGARANYGTITINNGFPNNFTITNNGTFTINNAVNIPGFNQFGYIAPLPAAVNNFEPPVERPIYAAAPANRQNPDHSKINTHTASIHKSVSESALQLQKRYPATEYKTQLLENLYTILRSPKHIKTILDSLKLSAESHEVLPTNDYLIRNINSGIDRIINNISWCDPTSNISLAEIFKIILVGINSLKDHEIQLNASLMLLEQIYRLQTEYNQGPMMSSASCDSGVFNGLIYSQQTIFPEQIKILIQTISHASVFLQYRMLAFAKNIFLTTSPEEHNNLEKFTVLVESAVNPEICATIVREVVEEYYLAFNYNSPEQAIKSFTKETLDLHCKTLAGCATADLFDFLPLDLNKLFTSLTAETPRTENPTLRSKAITPMIF